jgi:hypothetical protein
MFILERAQYKKRTYEAIEDKRYAKINKRKPKILSIIIDAMDNNTSANAYILKQETRLKSRFLR